MNEWVTVNEVAMSVGLTMRGVQKMAERKGCHSRRVPNPRGGHAIIELSYSALPEEWQRKISEHRLSSTLQNVNTIPVLPNNLPVQANGNGSACTLKSHTNSNVNLTNTNMHAAPPAKADKLGLAKYQLVCAWRSAVESQPWSKKGDATAAFLLAYRSGNLLPKVYELLGDVSVQTIYRPRAISNAAQEAILNCWLRPEKPTVSLAIRAARLVLEKRGCPEAAEDSTWRRWLRDFEKRNKDIVVLAREGEKALKDKVGPYITRDTSELKVGQVLVADGHDLDYEIIHPATGKPARLKLILFFDWASRMPAGWQIMPTENTAAISAALRNSIVTLGKIPQIVYLDNGKAFKSRFFTQTDPDFEDMRGIYARLGRFNGGKGTALVLATPYNARAKVIERFFLTFRLQFETLMHSFCGGSIKDKPAWHQRNEKFHRSMHERRTGGYIPDIREAAWHLSLFFEWYGRQPHDGLGGKCPLDVLDAGRGPGVDIAELDQEFLWPQKVHPSRCRVRLFNIDYESDCLYGWGEDVIARYDCADLSKIYLYSLDGAKLGEALPVEALNPIARLLGDQVSVDQVKKEIKRQRSLAKETKKNLIELGADPEKVESLDALPWNQRIAVLPGGQGKTVSRGDAEGAEKSTEQIEKEQEERKRLELVVSRAASEIEAREKRGPQIERPEYFRSEHARYEWAWRAVYEHKAAISNEDAAFMTYFETTQEFEENYASRYESLGKIYR
jgi:putative transposase